MKAKVKKESIEEGDQGHSSAGVTEISLGGVPVRRHIFNE
jgi:hypothetical protein